VLGETQIPESEWAKARYEELIMFDKRILWALHNV